MAVRSNAARASPPRISRQGIPVIQCFTPPKIGVVGRAIKMLPWPTTDMKVPVATVANTHHL